MSRSQIALESLEVRRLLAGQLDPFFAGNGGERALDPTTQPDQVLHLARGPGDTLYLAAQSGSEISLIRTTSVGTNESVIDTNIPSNLDGHIAVDSDSGRVAVAAAVQVNGNTKLRIGVFDFVANGPVTAFDTDGYKDLDIEPMAVKLAWQSGHLIVVSSIADSAHANDVITTVTRLKMTGTTDSAFGTNGTATLRDGVLNDSLAQSRIIQGLRIAGDGKIVLVTKLSATDAQQVPTQSIDLYRLTAGGDADAAFSGDAKITLYTKHGVGDLATVHDLHLRPDGTSATLWSLTAITPLGTSATNFISSIDSAGGKSTLFSGAVPLPTNLFRPNQLGIEAGGRYVLAGSVLPNLSATGASDTFVERLTKGGAIDTTYGAAGVYRAGVGHFSAPPHIVVQSSDDVVLAATLGSTDFKIGLARLLGDEPVLTLNKKGTLVLTSTDADDLIDLYIRSRDGRLMVRANSFFSAYAPSQVKRIAIFSGGGDDTITIGNGVRGSYADGGEGNDTLNGGQLGDVLLGGAGNDDLFGNDGDDILVGGSGNDYLLGAGGKDDLFGEAGNDNLSGAGGNDRLFGGAGSDNVRGGSGADAAASDDEDAFDSIETMLA